MGDMAPGTVFAGHTIEALAGRGGMGVVYRARQLSLDRTVALKVVAPALMQDPAIRQRFLRESRIAASIDHPNVIPIYYAGEEDGVAYIAMRFVAGDDLRTLVRREGGLEPTRAAHVVSQVAAALDAAHAAGLVHRDVKPANVLLAPTDHAYLTDFGLTKHVLSEAGATRSGQWVGTLDFVAPEQIRGERVDARADVYGLGCLLHYTLTGRPPFDHDSDEAKLWGHLTEPPPKVSAAGGPAAFDAVIARALAKDPQARYQSAGDLGRATLAAAAGEPVAEAERVVAVGAAAPVEAETRTAATQLAAPETRSGRTGARRRLATVAAALGLLAAGAGATALLATTGDDSRDKRPGQAASPAASAEPAIETVSLGGRPNAVAAAGGRIWVGRFADTRLTAVDPDAPRAIRRLRPEIGAGVQQLKADRGELWAALARDRQIARLDARTGRRAGDPIPLTDAVTAIALDNKSVWAATTPFGPYDRLLRINRGTHETLAVYQVAAGVRRLEIVRGRVWILSSTPAKLVGLDPDTGGRRKVSFESERTGDLLAARGFLWVTLPDGDQLARVDPRTGTVVTVAVGADPAGLAFHDGQVWVANRAASSITRVDAATGRVRGEPIEVPLNPYEMTTAGGAVWVTGLADGTVSRIRG